MISRQFQLSPNFHPITVRQALRHWYIPKKWQHYLRIEHNILVNGQYRSFNLDLQPNDQIQLNFTHVEPQQQAYPPSDAQHLTIFYEDQDILVVNKPSNVKTHPNHIDETNTLMNEIAAYLAPKHQQAYITHRLDMMTSGLILVAKNPLVVPILNAHLREKEIQRYYLAVIPYNFSFPEKGEITLPIGLDPDDKRKRKIRADGLPAVTDYKTLQKNRNYQLLHVQLQTGRTHQIRLHLAAQGVPILGDALYNPQTTFPRLMLHAYQMEIPLPFSNQKITVKTPIPMAFQNLFL